MIRNDTKMVQNKHLHILIERYTPWSFNGVSEGAEIFLECSKLPLSKSLTDLKSNAELNIIQHFQTNNESCVFTYFLGFNMSEENLKSGLLGNQYIFNIFLIKIESHITFTVPFLPQVLYPWLFLLHSQMYICKYIHGLI